MVYNYGVILENLTTNSFNVVNKYCSSYHYRSDSGLTESLRNKFIHRDLMISSIQDEILNFTFKYTNILELHTNSADKRLIIRLNRMT